MFLFWLLKKSWPRYCFKFTTNTTISQLFYRFVRFYKAANFFKHQTSGKKKSIYLAEKSDRSPREQTGYVIYAWFIYFFTSLVREIDLLSLILFLPIVYSRRDRTEMARARDASVGPRRFARSDLT